MPNNINVLLIGTGPMACSYLKVLTNDTNVAVTVVGRSQKSADEFYSKTGKKPIIGGVESFFNSSKNIYSHVIIATGIEMLSTVLIQSLKFGIENILIEKPAAISISELNSIMPEIARFNANIMLAYNRHFYASVLEVERLLIEDGELSSMHFEFTEWTHKIDVNNKPVEVLQNWFYANSSHVVDLAFYIAGKPKEFNCYTKNGNLSWHKKSGFVGAGVTENNVLFSYNSNWESAGRWVIELYTPLRKISLKPLEEIIIQKRGSLNVENHIFDNKIDNDFKPGLFRQVESFLKNDYSRMISIFDHAWMSNNVYQKIID